MRRVDVEVSADVPDCLASTREGTVTVTQVVVRAHTTWLLERLRYEEDVILYSTGGPVSAVLTAAGDLEADGHVLAEAGSDLARRVADLMGPVRWAYSDLIHASGGEDQ